MTQIEELLTLVEAYCRAAHIAEATLSSKVFADGKRISGIRAGSDVGVKRFATAMQWFSDNWPDGAEWPAGVNRPASSLEAAE